MAAPERGPLAADLERRARSVISAQLYDFIAGGADDEWALRANRAAFDRFVLRPRMLAGVENVTTEVGLLGTQLAAPLLVAPMGRHRMVHPEGELGTAGGAAAAGTGYIASTASSVTLEEIATAAPGARWFQLYFLKERRITKDLVERAAGAGYRALCLTVDVPVIGRRLRNERNQYTVPADIPRANLLRYDVPGASNPKYEGDVSERGDRSLRWSDLDWLRGVSELPLVIKGVMTGEDARLAVEAGAAALVVSNHGGRQLGRVAATVDVLEEVVDAVAGRVPVLLDGGVRTAADVVVALALGASAVGIGRPILWALACGGQRLVEAYLRGLIADLRRTLMLIGCSTIGDLGPGAVRRRQGS